jgi:hypothetical protein
MIVSGNVSKGRHWSARKLKCKKNGNDLNENGGSKGRKLRLREKNSSVFKLGTIFVPYFRVFLNNPYYDEMFLRVLFA